MLNELAHVVASLDRLGTDTGSRHPRINPMPRNSALLVVRIADDGAPSSIGIVDGARATKLFRVEHGSPGTSFPGFNLPTPLRSLADANADQAKVAIDALLKERSKKHGSMAALVGAAADLFKLSTPRGFTAKQEEQFVRSTGELVDELSAALQSASAELHNVRHLLDSVSKAKRTLAQFAETVANRLVSADGFDRETILLIQDILFGVLDWKKRSAGIATSDYWRQKAEQDEGAKQPVYLDLDAPDHRFKPVAHPQTSDLLNAELLRLKLPGARASSAKPRARPTTAIDAFSGEPVPLQDKYAGKTVGHIANFILFSANTKEVRALRRYGLEGSALFPASAALAQKMSDALLFLTSDQQVGRTCAPIPSAHSKKRDLLIAYLEEAPDFAANLADMFGGEAQAFNDADFWERASSVLAALEGELAKNPDINVRLLALCSLDPGRKQLSLHRQFRAADVVDAARRWTEGARNMPRISIWFWDKQAKQSVFKSNVVPHPLDVASVLNRVWSSDAKAGYAPSYQRIVSASDAYDVFFHRGSGTRATLERCLGILIARSGAPLIRLGAQKASRDWQSLGDPARWHCAKAVSLLGIFLQQLDQPKDIFMKEPVYQLGQLLALADSLHQQYCKHVRGDKAPTQLIGNAIFNTALEQPVFALARLAERLAPYQAWARTFKNTDPNVKSGWEKALLGRLRECAARFVEDVDGVIRIRADELPSRMTDLDKAKLLLGYLADTYEPETTTPTSEKS